MRLGRVTQAAPLLVEANGDTAALPADGPALAVGTEVAFVTIEGRRLVVYPGGGGDHPDADHADAFAPLVHGEHTAIIIAPAATADVYTYPLGTSLGTIGGDGITNGWPADYATVLTNYHSGARIFQIVMPKVGGQAWVRAGEGTTWTAFTEITNPPDPLSLSGGGHSPERKYRDLVRFGVGASPVTGAFVIRTHFPGRNNMSILRVSMFRYTTGSSFADLAITGYWRASPNYSGTSAGWNKRGPMPISQVRMGYDPAGNYCIVIGSETDSWAHPKISVDEWLPGYGSVNAGDADGWTIELLTSLTGYTLNTVTEYV